MAIKRILLCPSSQTRSPFRNTAMNAMKIAGTTLFILFAFIFNPRLLGFPDVDASMFMTIIEVLVTQIAFAAYVYCFKASSLQAAGECRTLGVSGAGGDWVLNADDLRTAPGARQHPAVQHIDTGELVLIHGTAGTRWRGRRSR
jgi:hypothetical protein